MTIDDHIGRKLKAIDTFGSQAGVRDYLEPDLIASTARYWSRYLRRQPRRAVRGHPRSRGQPAGPLRRRALAGDAVMAPGRSGRPLRVLITGAGGPAAIAAMMPGTLGLTIASGVDMPRLALAALLGSPLPTNIDFCEQAVVRFLDERFIDPGEIASVALDLQKILA